MMSPFILAAALAAPVSDVAGYGPPLIPRHAKSLQTHVIDVTVLYEAPIAASLGSDLAAEQWIMDEMIEVDRIYTDSDTGVSIRLAGIMQVPDQGYASAQVALEEMFEIDGAERFHFESEGDVLVLLMDGPSQEVCGITYGNATTWGRARSPVYELCGAETIAHEIGHMLGSMHDALDSGAPCDPATPLACGWGGSGFSTIMSVSYPNRLSVFSNPRLTCPGLEPCGDPDFADNATWFAQVGDQIADNGDQGVPTFFYQEQVIRNDVVQVLFSTSDVFGYEVQIDLMDSQGIFVYQNSVLSYTADHPYSAQIFDWEVPDVPAGEYSWRVTSERGPVLVPVIIQDKQVPAVFLTVMETFVGAAVATTEVSLSVQDASPVDVRFRTTRSGSATVESLPVTVQVDGSYFEPIKYVHVECGVEYLVEAVANVPMGADSPSSGSLVTVNTCGSMDPAFNTITITDVGMFEATVRGDFYLGDAGGQLVAVIDDGVAMRRQELVALVDPEYEAEASMPGGNINLEPWGNIGSRLQLDCSTTYSISLAFERGGVLVVSTSPELITTDICDHIFAAGFESLVGVQ